MVSMYRFDKIRNLIDQGLNNSEIARHLGIHRSTVRKYRRSNTPPSYQARSGRTREDPLANFTEKILEWVNGSDQLSATTYIPQSKSCKFPMRSSIEKSALVC